MNEIPLAFAFSAGMLATLNPCGFVMLPAFLSYQLGAQDTDFGQQLVLRRATQAVQVAAVATAGFLAVFAGVGGVFALGGRALMALVPWAAVGIGVALIFVGIAAWFGKIASVPVPTVTTVGYRPGFLPGFVFGIAYAVASLSCTLPIFLVVVGSALAAGGVLGTFVPFLAYALGMGAVLGGVALATALLKAAVVRWLAAIARYVHRAGALLLVAAGAYLVYFQLSTGFLLARAP